MDLYSEITDRIIAELKKGIVPWQKPWIGVSTGAISRSSGKPYSILNQMLLGGPGEYLTFKQCLDEGGKVKKGSKSRIVVFWKFLEKERVGSDGNVVFDSDGKVCMEHIPYLKKIPVFHIRDCEGIEPRHTAEVPLNDIKPDEKAESKIGDYIQRSGVKLSHEKQNRAFYRPSEDLIVMPLREQFVSTSEYYGTLFHEAVHSTGHSSRLNRLESGTRLAAFGSNDYSKEELVAEIGSATILNELGLETENTFRNSTAYIQNWLTVLNDDKKFIVSAASKSEKAVNMILAQ